MKRFNDLVVVRGAGRGKRLGVPTVNLEMGKVSGLKEGIYVCRTLSPFEYWGVMHFGPRPTFDESEKTLEINLFDYDGREVPANVSLEVYDFIRPVLKFDNADKMLEEINKDIGIAKRVIDKIRKSEK